MSGYPVPLWAFPVALGVLSLLALAAIAYALGRMARWDDAHREDDDYHSPN